MVGGFGKIAGDPPDIYHSYLGLAALALHHEPGLKEFDPALCITKDAKQYLESLPWRKAARNSASDPPNTSFSSATSGSSNGTMPSTASSELADVDRKYSYMVISGG